MPVLGLTGSMLWWAVTCAPSIIIFALMVVSSKSVWGVMTLSSWFYMDMMSLSLVVMTLMIGSLLMMSSSVSVMVKKNSEKLFIGTIVSLVLVLVASFWSSSFLTFYVFFEGSLIPTFMLVLAWGYQPERIQASLYLVVYTVGASLPLLASLIYFYLMRGSLMMDVVMGVSGMKMEKVWMMFMSVAFIVKLPLYFFHLWLPKAHVEAPVAGSMILAGVLLKLGGYGLLRVGADIISCNSLFGVGVFSIGLWGGVVASVICLRQQDLKSLIAYSSIGHMGIVAAGVMSGFKWGALGAVGMMVAHGLCSSALFSLGNVVYEGLGSRSLFLCKGVLVSYPIISFWWFLALAMNMAAPPSLNMLSEVGLMVSSIGVSLKIMVVFLMLSVMTGAYSLHLYSSINHGAVSVYSNSVQNMGYLSYLVVLLHLWPLVELMGKLEMVFIWI